jgi:hypothetical protein
LSSTERRRIPGWIPVLLAAALGLTASARLPANTHHYEAYVLGIRVGLAEVTIEQSAAGYSIEGRAEARGVASFFSDWHSEFYATGRFEGGAPVLETWGYDERNRKRTRTLNLTDGTIRMTRNGEPREPRSLPAGLDILTAFFIVPECWPEQLLHTGRYNYQVQGQENHRLGGCQYLVEDDDGDEARARIEFVEQNGQPLPVKLYTGGLMRGRIVLTETVTAPQTDPALLVSP